MKTRSRHTGENSSNRANVDTTKVEIKASQVNAIIVKGKGIMPKIAQERRMNPIRSIKQEIMLVVVQKNTQLMMKKKH